ncbi:Blue-light-activated protein [Methyloligella halotolerans]|uniref:histidine kinase n=1 Tax=Methyloligella halotolerans TaxID=1177755 RepID=A0A1E2RY67_9HYPH|nr:PAS domain-containing sensor histidine kinase [Methyloligella halotolerans]ODA67186.1 Blue-light-activated protein [Methyloligella halotolerans]
MLLDAVVDYAIYMLDTEGYISSWNAGAETIKGYPISEALGLHFSQFFTPEDQAAGKPLIGLGIAERTGRYEEEGWRVRKDGSRFWAFTVLDAIRDKEGNLLGFAKVTRDISERHAAEQALLDSEWRFRMLVDAVSDYAIFMLDTKGCITNWNKGAERIKGYKAHEVLGRHFSMFYTAEEQEADKPQKGLAMALSKGRYESEGIRVRKDGSTFWANVTIQPIRDEENRILGFAKVTRDISEQRKARQALEDAREELHQSQKMEALGHLTGGVAHDFNNFLTAIIGNLEVLKSNTGLDEHGRRQIAAALQAAEDGGAVVRQMMVFARRQAMRLVTVDVNKTVEEIAGLVRRSAHENIVLDLDLHDGVMAVKTDPIQLQTSVLNLALNACDAMPDGGVLTIKTEHCELEGDSRVKPGSYICISVTDTGDGMPEEVLAHAFDPFFTTKELGKGTGLGLSMVYGAAQQIGGDVSIASRVGEGTTVKLILPAGVVEDVEPQAKKSPLPKTPAGTRAPKKAKEQHRPPNASKGSARASQGENQGEGDALNILYVEDDFLVGLATIEILEKDGMTVQNAAGAEEALQLLDKHSEIDLLLTDIGLPGMSGHELVAEARRSAPACACSS